MKKGGSGACRIESSLSLTSPSLPMHASLWESLPQELLWRVLALLPLFCLGRFRCVCKGWRSLFESPAFRETFAEMNAYPNPSVKYYPLKLGRYGMQWFTYDQVANKWQRMPSLATDSTTSVDNDQHTLEEHIGGAGGLLLCTRKSTDAAWSHRLTIGNPLTKEWKDLPPMVNRWHGSAVLRVLIDETKKTYKIITAGNREHGIESEGFLTTEIYDSALGSWKEGGKFLPYGSIVHPAGAVCCGVLYVLVWRPDMNVAGLPRDDNKNVLIAYDIQQDAWSEVPNSFPAGLNGIPYIFEYQGRLLMMVCSHGAGVAKSCAFFELNFRSKEWVLFLQMPSKVFKGFARQFAAVKGCMSSGRRICVAGETLDGGGGRGKLLVVVHDVDRGTWKWLPAGPTSRVCSSIFFSFQPSLLTLR